MVNYRNLFSLTAVFLLMFAYSVQAKETVINAVQHITPPQTQEEAKALKEEIAKQSGAGFMNGEVPLFQNAKVVKTKSSGGNTSAELNASATPQEVIDFYSQKMTEKGWTPGLTMVQGSKGVATFTQPNRQLVIKAVAQGKTSTISMGIVGQ